MDVIYFPAKGDTLTVGEDVELEINGALLENFVFFNDMLEIAPQELRSLNASFRTAGGFKTRLMFPAGLEIKITDIRLRTHSRELDKIVFNVISWPGRAEFSGRRAKLMFALNPNIISGIKCSSIKKYDMNAMYVRSMTAAIAAMALDNVTPESQQELINLCESRINHGQITRDQADVFIRKIQSFDAVKMKQVFERRRKRDLFTKLHHLCHNWTWYVLNHAPTSPVGDQELKMWELRVKTYRDPLLDAMKDLKDDRTAEAYRDCIDKVKCLDLEYLDIPEELKP